MMRATWALAFLTATAGAACKTPRAEESAARPATLPTALPTTRPAPRPTASAQPTIDVSDAAAADPLTFVCGGDDRCQRDDQPGGVRVTPSVTFADIPEAPTQGEDPQETVWRNHLPYLAFRVHGLPAISADKKRVAAFESETRCCRGREWHEHTLAIYDVATGARRPHLLWTIGDESHTPMPVDTEPVARAKAKRLLGIWRGRLAKAKAELAGSWETMGELHREDDSHVARRGNLVFALFETDAGLPPLTLARGTARVSIPTRGWLTSLKNCPINLQIIGAFVDPGETVALVRLASTIGPNGCEAESSKLLPLPQ